MSCIDTKSKLSETKIIKLGGSDETVSVGGKPCIDFQPDDRWQIKDDESSQKVMSDKTVNELKNGGRRSQRLRSAKSNDSNPALNGEAAESSSESENSTKDELDKFPKVVDNHSKRKRKDPEPEDMPDSSTLKKIKANDSNDVHNSSLTENEKNEPEKTNDKMLNLSPAESDINDDSSKSTKDDLNVSVEVINCDDDSKEESSTKTNAENVNEIAPTVDKKGEDIEIGTPNGSESKEDVDCEIIEEKKSEDSESDSEVQIINPEALENPEIITTRVIADFKPATSADMHYTLSAGYPFYNSLKEKINNFKAGEYKPVKFPHTGTLFLGENEVIIESPSLLVPLLIKEADQFPKLEGEEKKVNGPDATLLTRAQISKRNFFQSSVGQFLINLGMSRVQEFFHRDMKRSKAKQLKATGGNNGEIMKAIEAVECKIEQLKQTNAAFNFRMHRCKYCDYKTESLTVLEGHYLMPHVTPRREYRCNFCNFIVRDAESIVSHYSQRHKKKAILDSYIPFHECIFCSFQSHLKNKVNAHMTRCRKHFIPAQNLSPPFDFEFPGVTTKPVTINDVIGHRRLLLSSGKNARAMPGQDENSILARKKLASVLTKIPGTSPYDIKNPNLMKQLMAQNQIPVSGSNLHLPPGLVISRGQVPNVRAPVRFQGARGMLPPMRGIPPPPQRRGPYVTNLTNTASQLASAGISITPIRTNSNIQAKQPPNAKNVTLTPIGAVSNRNVSQKPGPPQPVALFTNMAGSNNMLGQPQARLPTNIQLRPLRPAPPYQRLNTPPSQVVKGAAGNTYVVCEICDSFIKDLEELRTHMNWVHKVKIHPKMLVSRPPLNCQKCHWRFFTDQGLERHLLGAHGLVTTNMQEMANKNQDGGRCIICGAVFTYKLVSHMTQVHKVTLKPAHLSYKCTVCTATFTLYRLFESHVYNVHSGSSKRNADDSSASEPAAKKMAVESGPRRCKDCGFITENLQNHIIKNHMKDIAVKLCHVEKCEKCLNSTDEMLVITMADFGIGELSESGEDSSDESSSEESEEDGEDTSKSAKQESVETGDQKIRSEENKEKDEIKLDDDNKEGSKEPS